MSPRGPVYNRRVDGNHAEVREEYRRLGCYAKDVHGGSIGDLFVIVPCFLHPLELVSFNALKQGDSFVITCARCRRFFVETKKDEKEELTKNERLWQLLLGDQFLIVRSLDDVRRSVNPSKG